MIDKTKLTIALAVVGSLTLIAVPALAQPVRQTNVQNNSQRAGNTITNGSPSATSGSSAVGVGRVTVTTGVTNRATSTSGVQSSVQSDTSSSAAPSQSIGGTNFDRYAPPVGAPALTSGGIGICLGSFSAGLTGPMAGIAFGKTTTDAGCARARDSMILHNMGHKGAALRVLAGESIKDAMAAENLLPAKVSKSLTMDEIISAQLSPGVKPTTASSEQIFSEPAVATAVQGQ